MPFASLRSGGSLKVVPEGGTYIVLRVTDAPPVFLSISPAGHFKGQDQTVPLADMKANWVGSMAPASSTSARLSTSTSGSGAWPPLVLASGWRTAAAGLSGSWRSHRA
jgi:hypothetical protein